MIWFLIFCVDYGSDAQCQPPKEMPSQSACHLVGKNMQDLADGRVVRQRAYFDPRYKCIGVRK